MTREQIYERLRNLHIHPREQDELLDRLLELNEKEKMEQQEGEVSN